MMQKSVNVNLIKFSVTCVITVFSFIVCILLHNSLVKQYTQYAFSNNQLVFIDVETGQLVKGRLYNKKTLTTPKDEIVEAHI